MESMSDRGCHEYDTPHHHSDGISRPEFRPFFRKMGKLALVTASILSAVMGSGRAIAQAPGYFPAPPYYTQRPQYFAPPPGYFLPPPPPPQAYFVPPANSPPPSQTQRLTPQLVEKFQARKEFAVTIVVPGGQGTVFLTPATNIDIARQGGPPPRFLSYPSGSSANLVGAYAYYVQYPNGATTPLRFRVISSGGAITFQ